MFAALREKYLLKNGLCSNAPVAEEDQAVVAKFLAGTDLTEEEQKKYEEYEKKPKHIPLVLSRDETIELMLLKIGAISKQQEAYQKSMKKMLVFFTVLAVIELVAGLIGAIIFIAR